MSDPVKLTKEEEEQLQKENEEMQRFMFAFGNTPLDTLEHIKEVAMNRFNVKRSRRAHIRQILDDAFVQLKERADRALEKNKNVYKSKGSN